MAILEFRQPAPENICQTDSLVVMHSVIETTAQNWPDGRLGVIAAVPGSGKTTALESYHAQNMEGRVRADVRLDEAVMRFDRAEQVYCEAEQHWPLRMIQQSREELDKFEARYSDTSLFTEEINEARGMLPKIVRAWRELGDARALWDKAREAVKAAQSTPLSYYCSMADTLSTTATKRSLRMVAEAIFGTRPQSEHKAFQVLQDGIDDSNRGVVLIDEAHRLTVREVELLRGLSDKTKLPIVFAGNLDLCRWIGGAPEFAHFAERVGESVTIDHEALVNDVETLARWHGVHDQRAIAWLSKRVENGSCSLGRVTRIVKKAERENPSVPLKLTHLKDAAAY